MATVDIRLPDALKAFIEEQVSGRGCGTSSEHLRGQRTIRPLRPEIHETGLKLAER